MLQQGSGDIRFAADLPRPGDPPLTRYVIIAFDGVQQAQTWWNSEEWKPIRTYLDQHTKGRAFAVQAMPQ